MRSVIYGAQGIALGAYKAMKKISPEKQILCFLVTNIGENSSVLGELPVRELEEFASSLSSEEKDHLEVLIGTPESYMPDIEDRLKKAGFQNYIRIDSLTWSDMMKHVFSTSDRFKPLSTYLGGSVRSDIKVYTAKFWKDKELIGQYDVPDFMIPIQAGAAKTSNRVADVLDDKGDNISEKNDNYSELTVLYWMWKNEIIMDPCKGDKYYGLAHYRRFLTISDEDLYRLGENHIDVVLPYPMPYEPNIEVHHKRYLSEQEWGGVLRGIDELEPEYGEAFRQILKQGYLYNYNIIIAKGDVLSDYCSWLFPLLFRIEELNNWDGTKAPNRYIGYVGETLETLYFMFNKNGLKLAHTGCRFLL